MQKRYLELKTQFLIVGAAVGTIWYSIMPVHAESIESSKLATGTARLIQDATNWGMVLAPTIATVAIVYFFIRKAMADEMDSKTWNNRIVIAIMCGVGALLASVIVNVISSYYQ